VSPRQSSPLIRIMVKSFYSSHCLSKLLGFSKRGEAVRIESFLNPERIVVSVEDAEVFAIPSCDYFRV
jgi:hypothetical protein